MKTRIEEIKNSEIDNISISYELADNDGVLEHEVVILYTPDMENKMNHEHIKLSIEECYKLYKFLGETLLSITHTL